MTNPTKSHTELALVLRSYKFAESDRIIHLLTPKHGRINAIAKGARKTKSRYGASLEPLNVVNVMLYKGRSDLETVMESETSESFNSIKSDLKKMQTAGVILEAVSQVCVFGQPNEQTFRLTVSALKWIDSAESVSPSFVPCFFLRLLSLEGATPELYSCTQCSKTNLNDGFSFSVVEGGLICSDHAGGLQMSVGALRFLRMGSEGRVSQILSGKEAFSNSDIREVSKLTQILVEEHLGKKLKLANYLNR